MNVCRGRRFSIFFLIFSLGIFPSQCASLGEKGDRPENSVAETKRAGKKVYSFDEINRERVFEENQGLRILEENAITVNDYYRAGVQEKEIAEGLSQQGNLAEARGHFEKSNQFLRRVAHHIPEDEVALNIYGDHTVIFIPNLLLADNHLKIARVCRQAKKMSGEMMTQKGMPKSMVSIHDEMMNMSDKDIYWILWAGQEFLSRSLKSVKTEWALHLQKELEKELQR